MLTRQGAEAERMRPRGPQKQWQQLVTKGFCYPLTYFVAEQTTSMQTQYESSAGIDGM
jgi:hypothetical protein